MDPPNLDEHNTRARTSSLRSLVSGSFSARAKSSQDDAKLQGKGPLGLTTLYAPSPEQVPAADIVFVHGIRGGSYSTWTRGNSTERFWPREWLPQDDAFKDVRIHTFGYPSGVSRESIINISDVARSLLAAVKDSPVMNTGKQVCNTPTSTCCWQASALSRFPTNLRTNPTSSRH
jgi:hypothetical protein